MPLMSTNMKSGSSLSSAACLRYPVTSITVAVLPVPGTPEMYMQLCACVCVRHDTELFVCLSVCLSVCMCVYRTSYPPVLLRSFPSTKERILANSFSLQGRDSGTADT